MDELTQSIFGKKVHLLNKAEGVKIAIDATTSISPRYSSTVTQNKVEDGYDIASNITDNSNTFNLSGYISSERPEDIVTGNIIGNIAHSIGRNINSVGQLASNIGLGKAMDALDVSNHRVLDIHNKILEIKSKKVPLEVVGSLFKLSNMVITDYSPSRTTKTGNGFSFKMGLTEVRFIKFESIEIELKRKDTPKKLKEIKAKNAGKETKGFQPAKEVDQSAKSALKSLTESFPHLKGMFK